MQDREEDDHIPAKKQRRDKLPGDVGLNPGSDLGQTRRYPMALLRWEERNQPPQRALPIGHKVDCQNDD